MMVRGDLTQSRICYIRAINKVEATTEVLQLHVEQGPSLETTKTVKKGPAIKGKHNTTLRISTSFKKEH
ncbi:hypothetical protein MA16_Dca019448 [Dendrobium catenatum]|uniref:Uncharacterized protein n=1 Tax=Dendrobium catenatum TaxID=906689 RepID=A0A2I0WHD9_9ASPA|nr:hypothetical protein MA16_Dca019448 [Dendrobium catenatum]